MADRIVTCVYCGHEYPDGTPTSQDKKLTEHIRICEKHPMRELEQQLAAANARIAELENQKPSYKKEFDCVYEKLKAEESLSKHYNQRAEQAEAQCDEMEVINTDLCADNKRMREALEEIKQECLDDIDCGEESALGAEIRRIIAALEVKP